MSFHENLKKLRTINKISQERFAEILGVSRQAVTKYESGKCYPDVEKLIAISNLFNVSLDDLLKVKESNCINLKNILDGGNIMDKKIIGFLCRAKKETYAAGKAEEEISSRPGSHDLKYIEGNLKYIDTYLGSQNFVGEEGIWKDNCPIWSMNYSGRVLSSEFEGSVLHEALKNVKEDKPFRGPKVYKKDDFTYECTVNGDCSWFEGKEVIYKKDVKVYECLFHGGVVL